MENQTNTIYKIDLTQSPVKSSIPIEQRTLFDRKLKEKMLQELKVKKEIEYGYGLGFLPEEKLEPLKKLTMKELFRQYTQENGISSFVACVKTLIMDNTAQSRSWQR